ncbi:(d)CMP kinase [Isosphaeraceae bacterium EP7]
MRVVTIDGPAGAGKSTVARLLAGRLGWGLLDTGAMYRAVTLAALRDGVDLSNESALAALVISIRVRFLSDYVELDGQDVTDAIRAVEITRRSGAVADSPSVRARLVAWQREAADDREIVTEGRDQGTIVFPDALCKFFITASPEERARRRLADFRARGDQITYEQVLDDQRLRDERDAARAIAPMVAAPDARLVDTTGKPLEAVVDSLERAVRACEVPAR